VLTDVDAHTHTHLLTHRTDLLWSRGGVSREYRRRRDLAGLLCLTTDAAWGFSLDVIRKDAREERLHRRFSCFCGFLHESTQFNDLSPHISASFSGTKVMRCCRARARRPWSCARSWAERWTTTPSTKTAANSLLSRPFLLLNPAIETLFEMDTWTSSERRPSGANKPCGGSVAC